MPRKIMSNSDETLEQPTKEDLILQALADISKKLVEHDAQFEAIRQGIVDNNVRLHRLESGFHNFQAEFAVLTEEIRHNRNVLV